MNLRLSILFVLIALVAKPNANGNTVPPVWASHIISLGVSPNGLTSFEVSDMETKVALSWATNSEKNTNHIFVERSLDGVKWTSVSKIKAAENSDHLLYYEFYDETPVKGTSYYRLKIQDLDGLVEYSGTKVVERTGKEVFAIVYPNASLGLLNLAFSYNVNEVVYEIFDASGKQVVIIGEVVSEEKIVLDVSDLAKGVYTVNIKSNEGKILNSQKVTLK